MLVAATATAAAAAAAPAADAAVATAVGAAADVPIVVTGAAATATIPADAAAAAVAEEQAVGRRELLVGPSRRLSGDCAREEEGGRALQGRAVVAEDKVSTAPQLRETEQRGSQESEGTMTCMITCTE